MFQQVIWFPRTLCHKMSVWKKNMTTSLIQNQNKSHQMVVLLPGSGNLYRIINVSKGWVQFLTHICINGVPGVKNYWLGFFRYDVTFLRGALSKHSLGVWGHKKGCEPPPFIILKERSLNCMFNFTCCIYRTADSGYSGSRMSSLHDAPAITPSMTEPEWQNKKQKTEFGLYNIHISFHFHSFWY